MVEAVQRQQASNDFAGSTGHSAVQHVRGAKVDGRRGVCCTVAALHQQHVRQTEERRGVCSDVFYQVTHKPLPVSVYGGPAFEHVLPPLDEDIDVVCATITITPDVLKSLPPALQRNDRVQRTALINDGMLLQLASAEIKQCKKCVMLTVQSCCQAIEYADASLRGNFKFMHRAAKSQSWDKSILQHASPALQANAAFVKPFVSKNGLALQFASADLKDDETIVGAAVMNDGGAIQYASQRLQAHRPTALKVIRTSICAFKYLAPTLKANPALALATLRSAKHGQVPCHDPPSLNDVWCMLPLSLRSDRAFVLAALKAQPDLQITWQELSKNLRTDKRLIFALIGRAKETFMRCATSSSVSEDVKSDPVLVQVSKSLHWASDSVKKNKDVVLNIISDRKKSGALSVHPFLMNHNFFINSDSSLMFAHDDLMSDKHFLLQAVHERTSNGVLDRIPSALWADAELMVQLVGQLQSDYQSDQLETWYWHLAPDLKNSRDFVRRIVEKRGALLRYVNPEFQADKDIVFAAVASCVEAMQDAADVLQYSAALVESVVRAYPAASKFIKKVMLKSHRPLALLAVAHNGLLFADVGEALQQDEEVATAAAMQNASALNSASPDIKTRIGLLVEQRHRRRMICKAVAWSLACYSCVLFGLAKVRFVQFN